MGSSGRIWSRGVSVRKMSLEIITGALGTEEAACKLTQEYRERAHASAFKAQGRRGGREKVEETGDMGAEQNTKLWFPGSCSFKRVLKDIKKWNKMRIEKCIVLLPVRGY